MFILFIIASIRLSNILTFFDTVISQILSKSASMFASFSTINYI